MLYVFLMDNGSMLTFDISLALKTVANLQKVINDLHHIPEDRQVLLISGGENLDPSHRVASYSAGTDTNPIFLFSRSTIEGTPPVSTMPDSKNVYEIQEKVEGTMNMPASYETVVTRTQMALELHDVAKQELKLCEKVVHDQHLQHQGWAAAVANLDDMISYFNRWVDHFKAVFGEYLTNRDLYIDIVERFDVATELLGRIPFLEKFAFACDATQLEGNGKPRCKTLMEWIQTRDSHNLQDTLDVCSRGLQQFDENLLESLSQDVQAALENAEAPGMKEVKGLEDRLFKLEQLMHTSKKLVQEQSDLAQGFIQNQNRASNMRDNSIFPDLCDSHKQQLQVMLRNQMRLQDCREKCSKAKGELCSNLHTRLRWLLYVERSMSELLSRLTLDFKELGRIKQTCLILEHLHKSPEIYVAIIVEIYRRRNFKEHFTEWASKLSSECQALYLEELAKRRQIVQLVGNHFFGHLFPGLLDTPPPFANAPPNDFDRSLPDITADDILSLQKEVPELEQNLRVPECFDLSKYISPVKVVMNSSQTVVADDSEELLGSIEILSPPTADGKYLEFEIPTKPKDTACTDESNSRLTEIKETDDNDLKTPCIGGIEMVLHKNNVSSNCSSLSRSAKNISSHNKTTGSVDDRTLGVTSHGSLGNCEVLPKSRSDSQVGDIASSCASPDANDASMEFTTAVFYMDESMPSSMTESPPMRLQVARINELQLLVTEKTSIIEQQLTDIEVCHERAAKAEEQLKLLRDLAEKQTLKLKCDLLSTEKYIQKEKEDMIEFIDLVSKSILSAICKIESNYKSEHEINMDDVKSDYEGKISNMSKILEDKCKNLEYAGEEVENYRQKLYCLESQIKKCQDQYEVKLKQQSEALENEKHETIRNLTLEHEVDMDKIESDFKINLQAKEVEIAELAVNLGDKGQQIAHLESELAKVSETLKETFQNEKDSLLQELMEEFKLKQECTVGDLESKHKNSIEILKNEHENAISRLSTNIEAKITEECWTRFDKETAGLKVNHDRELEKQSQRHEEEVNKLRDVMEQEKLAAVQSMTQSMTESHKQDIEALRAELEKQKRLSLESPSHEPDEAMLSKWREEKDVAVSDALSKQTQEFESKMACLRKNLEQEKIDGVKALRTKLIAERQVAFNEAISRLSSEKEKIIEDLRSKEKYLLEKLDTKNSLNMQLERQVQELDEQNILEVKKLEEDLLQAREEIFSLKTDKNHPLMISSVCEAMTQSVMSASVIPVRECSSDTDNAAEKIHELEATLKSREEEVLKMQSKLMELSMTQSTRTMVQQHDKVSITTCNVGDLVLLCLDERHDHYVVFTVGTTLHFLHSDCLEALSLKTELGEAKKSWVLAEIIEKEYCQARKPQNRFKVPVGTKFYRVKAKPWERETSGRPSKKASQSACGVYGGPPIK